jgi:hypothetical protein
MSDVSLLTLPVETLYRIFDYCDVQRIYSVRRVCRQLYAVASTYDRFHLNINLNSKHNFKLLAQCIPPESIISITVNNNNARYYDWRSFTSKEDVISSFTSSFKAHQFTRLRSLTINQISDNNIDQLIRCFNINFLVSLSVDPCKRECSETSAFINFIIAQPCIRKLCLKNSRNILKDMLWPVQCKLEHLTVNICVHGQYANILQEPRGKKRIRDFTDFKIQVDFFGSFGFLDSFGISGFFFGILNFFFTIIHLNGVFPLLKQCSIITRHINLMKSVALCHSHVWYFTRYLTSKLLNVHIKTSQNTETLAFLICTVLLGVLPAINRLLSSFLSDHYVQKN